jgi:hypothetical protein
MSPRSKTAEQPQRVLALAAGGRPAPTSPSASTGPANGATTPSLSLPYSEKDLLAGDVTDYELPKEATELLARIGRVEEQAQVIRDELTAHVDAARAEFERERAELERDQEVFKALVEERSRGHELVAEAWREYELARADMTAEFLEQKKRAGPGAAEQVRAKGRELAETRRRLKLAEYVVQLYEWHFPWLVDFRDVGEGESYVEEGSEAEVNTEDPAREWLTREEWQALPEVERNQRALDRYLRSRKTPWQLGRDYERYIGYLREQDGYRVTYHGIFKGLEDLGRDILAERDGAIEVIQCKRWAKHKTIHEKHIFQLYGTMVLAKLENPKKKITGTFTTTTKLSEKAREVADYLDIKVEEGVPLGDYPRIKCNVARRNGEQIYHLPFDQQYDTTIIEPDRGELYVTTTAEAEALGFRRAWRWLGP